MVKPIAAIIGGIILLIAIAFAMTYGGLIWQRFFDPKFQNVEREVFEETKSYTHGVIQDLAKYHDEYQKADVDERQAIQATIKFRFAEFDANNIQPITLKNWFVQIRGY